MRVDEVLEAGAEYIVEKGWNQGKAYAEGLGTAACVVGAMDVVAGCQWQAAYEYLLGHLGGMSVTAWNDRPDRTKEEVIETMREAAQRWRKENA